MDFSSQPGFAQDFVGALNAVLHDSLNPASLFEELVAGVRQLRSFERISINKRTAQSNARMYLATSCNVRLVVLQADRKPYMDVINPRGIHLVVVLHCRDPLLTNALERNSLWLLEPNWAWQPQPSWYKQRTVRHVQGDLICLLVEWHRGRLADFHGLQLSPLMPRTLLTNLLVTICIISLKV
jgi:hypothetical protein